MTSLRKYAKTTIICFNYYLFDLSRQFDERLDMDDIAKLYCIYNAEGSIIGKIRYVYNKYIKDIKCSMCEITHNSFSEKSEWGRKCKQFPFEVECLHLDELPSDIKDLVKNNTPCVVAQKKSVNEVIIKNKELVGMNGDIGSFFNHLHEIINN